MSSRDPLGLSCLYRQRFLGQRCDQTLWCIYREAHQSHQRQAQIDKLVLDVDLAIAPNDDRSLLRLVQYGYHC